MVPQEPLPRHWEPEEQGTRPHICERARISTTLVIKQKCPLQLPAELGELFRTATNGEGVSRFHSLTHLSEPTRTFFPKSSGFPTPFPTPKECGRSRTSTNDSELNHLDAICSSIHSMTSCSFQTTEREPNWICLGKVPSFTRA